MSDQTTQLFGLPKEVVQEMLNHLAKDPTAALYQKVARAVPFTITTPAQPPQDSTQEDPKQS